MGYTTEFSGKFNVNPLLHPDHVAYLKGFADQRHMKRDVAVLATVPDPLRTTVNLPLGVEGEYSLVDEYAVPGSVLDHNREPSTQPGLWCQWIPTDDGSAIQWDGNEKFYNYTEWLQYIIDHFMRPWGYELNGRVMWSGEDTADSGVITVEHNIMTIDEFQPGLRR